ncbi:MAG: hypothetical protein V3V08_18655 [Nannocystaceae bacterium]
MLQTRDTDCRKGPRGSLYRDAQRTLGTAVGVSALLVARACQACPVCFSAKNEDNQLAFIVTTGILTFTPLLMIGAFAWWLRRRLREIELAHPQLPSDRPAPVSAPPPGATGLVSLIARLIASASSSPRRRARSTQTPH